LQASVTESPSNGAADLNDTKAYGFAGLPKLLLRDPVGENACTDETPKRVAGRSEGDVAGSWYR
jgi:hypothetical protein